MKTIDPDFADQSMRKHNDEINRVIISANEGNQATTSTLSDRQRVELILHGYIVELKSYGMFDTNFCWVVSKA